MRITNSQSAEVLQAESGYEQEPALASSFRQAILGGRWSEAIQLLSELGVVSPDDKIFTRRNSIKKKSGDLTVGSETRRAAEVDVHKQSAPFSDMSMRSDPLPSAYASASSLGDIDADHIKPATQTTITDAKKEDTPGRRAIFMVLRQKYLELIEACQTVRALRVLRSEVAPLATDTAKLHALSGQVMLVLHNWIVN
jgi:hypothetical protein